MKCCDSFPTCKVLWAVISLYRMIHLTLLMWLIGGNFLLQELGKEGKNNSTLLVCDLPLKKLAQLKIYHLEMSPHTSGILLRMDYTILVEDWQKPLTFPLLEDPVERIRKGSPDFHVQVNQNHMGNLKSLLLSLSSI